MRSAVLWGMAGMMCAAPSLALVLALGCSQSSSSGPSCTVEGAYSVTYSAVSDAGTCGPPAGPPGSSIATKLATVTVSGTHADVALEDHPGSCPGLVKGCDLTVLCTVTNQATGGQGSLSVEWTFTAVGFRGSSHAVVPLDDGGACTLNEGNSGVRK
jgi:hypothetical protein